MNIIIVGNGKVGYPLAQYLSKDGHDVTVLDKSQQALLRASETLDVMCVRGNGANVKVLIEAGEGRDVGPAMSISSARRRRSSAREKFLSGEHSDRASHTALRARSRLPSSRCARARASSVRKRSA